MDMLKQGMKYRELCKSYVIFICTFDPFGKGLPMYLMPGMDWHNHPGLLEKLLPWSDKAKLYCADKTRNGRYELSTG